MHIVPVRMAANVYLCKCVVFSVLIFNSYKKVINVNSYISKNLNYSKKNCIT